MWQEFRLDNIAKCARGVQITKHYSPCIQSRWNDVLELPMRRRSHDRNLVWGFPKVPSQRCNCSPWHWMSLCGPLRRTRGASQQGLAETMWFVTESGGTQDGGVRGKACIHGLGLGVTFTCEGLSRQSEGDKHDRGSGPATLSGSLRALCIAPNPSSMPAHRRGRSSDYSLWGIG